MMLSKTLWLVGFNTFFYHSQISIKIINISLTITLNILESNCFNIANIHIFIIIITIKDNLAAVNNDWH